MQKARSIPSRIAARIGSKILMGQGNPLFFARHFYDELIEDFFGIHDLSLKQKIWAYRKGMFSERVKSYHLTEANYRDYLPEFDYYKLHPINGQYGRWIDDKLTIRYLLAPYAEFMPLYFFQIANGRILSLMDCPPGYPATVEGILSLLSDKKDLAFKLNSGTKGDGFYRVSQNGDLFSINNKPAGAREVRSLISGLDGYLVTEFLFAHPLIRRIFPDTPNSMRLMVIRDDAGSHVAAAFIRFGTKKTSAVDNISLGGIFCGVDIRDGTLFRPYDYDKNMNLVDCPIHPDSGVRIEGRVPHWDLMIRKVLEIGDYLPQLVYLGYDVVATEDGFRIIEINSLQGPQHIQLYYPFMKDERVRRFFEPLLASVAPRRRVNR